MSSVNISEIVRSSNEKNPDNMMCEVALSPCERINCEHWDTCADELKACMAFYSYVTSPNEIDYRNRFKKILQKHGQKQVFEPSRSFFNQSFNEAR